MVASVIDVSSFDTRSTQSKVSPIGKRVENLTGALAHQRRHQGDVGRRQRRADRLALGAVVRFVKADERCALAAPRGLDLLLLGALARQPQALAPPPAGSQARSRR